MSLEQMSLLQKFVTQKNYQADKKVRKKEKGKKQSGLLFFSTLRLIKIEILISVKMPPGTNIIKLFTAVIYRHSMVLLSFCVIKH